MLGRGRVKQARYFFRIDLESLETYLGWGRGYVFNVFPRGGPSLAHRSSPKGQSPTGPRGGGGGLGGRRGRVG